MKVEVINDLNFSNQPSHNGFNLVENPKFSAKCGELLPVYHRTLMPGNNFKINSSINLIKTNYEN